MNTEQMDILTNIITSECEPKDYGAYNDSPLALGWARNSGDNVYRLLKAIFNADRLAFRKLDTDGEIESLLSKDWKYIKWEPTESQKETIIALIDSKAGHKCQDQLFVKNMSVCASVCKKKFTDFIEVVMMYCIIAHFDGKDFANKVFNKLYGDYSLDTILSVLSKELKTEQNLDIYLRCKEAIVKGPRYQSQTETEATKLYGVTLTLLNVRVQAGMEYETCSFSPLRKGETIEICDTVNAADNTPWYYILYNGQYGFVCSKFVSRQ